MENTTKKPIIASKTKCRECGGDMEVHLPDHLTCLACGTEAWDLVKGVYDEVPTYPEWVTNCDVDNATIIMDIADTQREIDQYRRELEALAGDKQKNRMAIYLAEGNISRREGFIKQLRLILQYRSKS